MVRERDGSLSVYEETNQAKMQSCPLYKNRLFTGFSQ